jgi:hypothetical protein
LSRRLSTIEKAKCLTKTVTTSSHDLQTSQSPNKSEKSKEKYKELSTPNRKRKHDELSPFIKDGGKPLII